MGGISPFHRHGRGTRWQMTSFATHRCSSDCFGSVCCCIGHGDGVDPRRARRRPRTLTPSRSALVTRSPFPASSTSLTTRRVSPPWCLTVRHPPSHHPGSYSREDAGARLTHGSSSVPTRSAPITAGWVGAPSAPMAIPVANRGGNFSVSRARTISRKRTARRCMARASHPSGSCGQWAHWPKAWASARWLGSLRSIPIRCCSG
jgi:hypothetical protein